MDAALARIGRIERLARLGYAARGVVYVVIGWVVWRTGRGTSAGNVIEAVRLLPLGGVLLATIGLGLFGYGLFRIYEALLDLEGEGEGWRARAARAGRALGGLGYWVLAFIALRTLVAGPAGGGGEAAARGAALEVQHEAGGGFLLLLVGAGVIALALAQARHSWRCDFMALCHRDTPKLVRHLGRGGFAARAVVIALIGGFLVRAGIADTPVRGMGGAIDALSGHPLLLGMVAAGLALFGLFSLALSHYRRIDDEAVVARLKARFA
jgi:hypothetical protein